MIHEHPHALFFFHKGQKQPGLVYKPAVRQLVSIGQDTQDVGVQAQGPHITGSPQSTSPRDRHQGPNQPPDPSMLLSCGARARGHVDGLAPRTLLCPALAGTLGPGQGPSRGVWWWWAAAGCLLLSRTSVGATEKDSVWHFVKMFTDYLWSDPSFPTVFFFL